MDYEAILQHIQEQPEHMFRTERGSTYGHYADNTTVRNRSGDKHRDTSTGIQPRSGKTVYLSPADVQHMAGLFQNAEMATRFVPVSYDKETRTGKVALVHAEDFGPHKAGSVIREATFTTVPQVGLNPVEIYKSESPRGDSGRGVHWGNKITEIHAPRSGGGSGGAGVSDTRDMQLGAELDPKALMRRGYASGGAIRMPEGYSAGSWKLI